MNRRALLLGFLAAPAAVKLGRFQRPPEPVEMNVLDVDSGTWYPTFMALWAAHGWHLHGRRIRVKQGPLINADGPVPYGSSVIGCHFDYYGKPPVHAVAMNLTGLSA